MTLPASSAYPGEIDYFEDNSQNMSFHSVNVNNRNLIGDLDSYSKIYKFILTNILSEYDVLCSCDLLHEDELGNPSIEFYIKYDDYLSFDERNILNYKILEEIYDFCVISKLANDFEDISIFLVQK